MTSAPVGAGRLDSLTSLRFFAAIIVVLHHGTLDLVAVPILTEMSALGYVGVTFFFVLSGFVLAWSGRTDLPKRHFYGRRFARIYPTQIVTLAIALALTYLAGSSVAPGVLASNVLLLQSWVPLPEFTDHLNNVSWSISDEMFFYAIFPFVFAAWIGRSRKQLIWRIALVIVGMVVVAAAVRFTLDPTIAGNILYKNPAFRVGEFLIGIALARLVKSGWRLPISFPVAAGGTVAIYLLMAGGLAVAGKDDLIRVIPNLIMLLPFAALIVTAAQSDLDGRTRRLMRSRPLVFLGEASFQLYMTHYLLLLAIALLPVTLTPALGLVAVLGYTLLAVGVSCLAFMWFEKPTEKWLRARLGGTRAARADATQPR